MSNFAASRMSDDHWATPKAVYDSLNAEFYFNDDPCPLNGTGGLEREWGTSTYVNPPYSNPTPWCKKAYEESQKGKTIVMLLRGDTSTRWFHDWVLGKAELRFLKGRLHFNGKKAAPFASIIAIYRPNNENHDKESEQMTDKEERRLFPSMTEEEWRLLNFVELAILEWESLPLAPKHTDEEYDDVWARLNSCQLEWARLKLRKREGDR